MTKYILEGGNYFNYPDKAKSFFNEALEGLGEQPTILWCMFATDSDERADRYQKYISKAAAVYPEGVRPISIEAVEDDFEAQVAEADLINIQGGSTVNLRTSLEKYDLEKLFDGKVVGGHSAGANIMASSFWSPGLRQFGQGFGIFPIKTLTHYGSDYGSDDPRGQIDWERARQELVAYKNQDHEVLALEEGEFVVFEK